MLIRRCAKPDKNGDPLTHAASAAAGHALLRMPSCVDGRSAELGRKTSEGQMEFRGVRCSAFTLSLSLSQNSPRLPLQLVLVF
jgi:hypothetical protein